MRWTAAGDSLLSMREEGEQEPGPERARRSSGHASHLRVRSQNGANLTVLLVALRYHHLGGGAGRTRSPSCSTVCRAVGKTRRVGRSGRNERTSERRCR